MRYPNVLKITYISNQDELAIIINESTHYIQSGNDVDVACDLLNVFSEITWTKEKFHNLVEELKYLGEFEEITVTVM